MKYPIAANIFFLLFLLASFIQLILAFIEKERLRQLEKPLCLFFLGLFANLAIPTEPLIYCACFLAMVGDILDLYEKTFYIGVVSFFFGHICAIFEVLYRIVGISNISIYSKLLILFIIAITIVAMYLACKGKTNHGIVDKIGQSLYFAILASYLPIFIISTIIVGKFLFLAIIGGALFIVSDSIFVKKHFDGDFKRCHFYVMSTYLSAEALIVIGLILTVIA